MSLPVSERPQARKDFWEIVDFLAVHKVSAAERFIEAIQRTQGFLADFPISGTLIEDDELGLKGLRITQVSGFDNYLVVFRSRADRVEILRYAHASRDLMALLREG